MSTRITLPPIAAATLFVLCFSCQPPPTGEVKVADLASADSLDRTVLPVKEPAPQVYSELDARNAKKPNRFEVKAPAKAPNVVIVLIDDIGFGQSSAFGGPVNMPTLEKLARNGLKYNRFHTTALCSPNAWPGWSYRP